MSEPMQNFYLLSPTHPWAAVCISKNACSTLKSRALDDAGVVVAGEPKSALHDRVGYDSSSSFLDPVAGGRDPARTYFAVWRDPVDRFMSTYQHLALDGHAEPRHAVLVGVDLDGWIDFAAGQLELPPHEQDEHVRPQSQYYGRGDVDRIVPIARLSRWFTKQGWGRLANVNPSETRQKPTPMQVAKIAHLYEADFRFRPTWWGSR